MNDETKTLSTIIARLARGGDEKWRWTQAEVAAHLGWSDRRVIRYELSSKQFAPLTFEAIEGLAEVLGRRLDALDGSQRAAEVHRVLCTAKILLDEEVVDAVLGDSDPPDTDRVVAVWTLAAYAVTAQVRAVRA